MRYGCIIHPLARVSPGVKLGKGCVIAQSQLRTYYGGQITIGSNTTIHADCEFFAHEGSNITIGENCLIAKRTIIMTRKHTFDDPGQRIIDQKMTNEDVTVGSDVWTGLGTKILPGVKIGNGCVIGTSAVVTKDIPEKSIAVGIPAKVIKKRGQ